MSLLEEWNLKDAVAVAEKDGKKLKALEIAKKMKARGNSIDEIIELTDLTVDDILRL
jgi:predicted transposase YdaD